jgi:ankyrin repeat protein
MDIFEAIKDGNLEVIKKLIKAGADVNIQDEIGDTPLFLAVDNIQYDTVVELLKIENIDVNIQNKDKCTALMLASIDGSLDIVLKLLEHKNINLNIEDVDGNTALMISVREGHLEIAKALIEANAEVNIKNNKKETAITLIIEYYDFNISHDNLNELNEFDVLKLLLQNGANPNILYKYYDDDDDYDSFSDETETPLINASVEEYIDVVKLLLDYGADIRIKDDDGYDAFDNACLYNSISVVEEFIKRYDIGCFSKTMPLKLASAHKNTKVVQILLKNGYTRFIKPALRELAIGNSTRLFDKTFAIPFLYKRFRKINHDIIRESLDYI